MKYSTDNPLQILFVCFANMGRSPMAEAIVKKRLGEAVHAESRVSPSPRPKIEK